LPVPLSVVVALTRCRGSMPPPCFPPTVCDKVPSFPLTGSPGLVRPLHWYFEDTPTSAARLTGSLRSPGNTRAAPFLSLPPVQGALPEGLGLSGSVTPYRFLKRWRRQTSQVPGEPCWMFALFSDPGGTSPPGQYRRLTRPPSFRRRRLAARNGFRGSIARLSSSLSTLRPAGRPDGTQDSFPAAGHALPGGIGYPQGSYERFQSCFLHLVPLSQALPGATKMPLWPACSNARQLIVGKPPAPKVRRSVQTAS
jgi:hypothetical protein